MAPFTVRKPSRIPTLLKVLVSLAIVLGIFFRFVALDTKVYSNDETFSSLQIFGHDLTEIINSQPVSVSTLQNYQRFRPDESLSEAIDRLVTQPYVYPPLYPILMQFWARFWSMYLDHPAVIQRSLSAAISLFSLVCMYWLCWELSGSKVTAWVATAILAVSPFHMQYAQIVRTYSLTTVATLAASAALLQAMRFKTNWSWLVYAVTVSFGLYSNVLFGFVAIAHAAYVLLIEKFRFSPTIRRYGVAAIVGGLMFLPWFYLFLTKPGLLNYSVAQVLNDASLSTLIKTWIKNLGPIFFDFYDPWVKFTFGLAPLHQLLFLFAVFLVASSSYFICRHAPKQLRLFVLTLLGLTGVILMVKDLTTGGSFSTRLRYMIPSVITIEIAVAHFLASGLQSRIAVQKKLSELSLVILMVGGIFSCSIISQAESWWAFGSPDSPAIAATINQSDRPVVVFEDWGDALTMSYWLSPQVYSHLTRQVETYLSRPDHPYVGFSDIFLFKPSDQTRQRVEAVDGYQLEQAMSFATDLPQIPEVWRIAAQKP